MDRLGIETNFVSSYSGLKIAALMWGHQDARIKIIGLHGWMDNAATWSHVVSNFVTKQDENLDICVVSVDLPGHGKSDHRSSNAPYYLVDYIPDILSVCDELKWEKFSIMGHSMGAGIATIMAGAFPKRVNSLIVVEGFGPWVNDDNDFATNLATAITTNKIVFTKKANRYQSKEEALKRLAKSQPTMKECSLQTLIDRGTIEDQEGKVYFRHDVKLRCSSLL